MTTFHDVHVDLLLPVVSERLQSEATLTPPEWAEYVKTGVHRERIPDQPDWWYMRAAAMLRKIAINGPLGSKAVAGLYGGARDRGGSPDRAKRGSRHIARTLMQQLEDAGLLVERRSDGGVGYGRGITGAGQALLDAAASEVRGASEARSPGLDRY